MNFLVYLISQENKIVHNKMKVFFLIFVSLQKIIIPLAIIITKIFFSSYISEKQNSTLIYLILEWHNPNISNTTYLSNAAIDP